MNAPTTFQRSSSWTLQSYLKNKDTPQDDGNDNDLVLLKTEFLRGFSGVLDTSAAFDVLPHEVENHQDSSKTPKLISTISSSSETDTRSSESDDDDSWIDALCDVPVEMIDAIDPLPVFNDVAATPANSPKNHRKRKADDLNSPPIVTFGKHNPLRRVSMDGFLPAAGTAATPSKSKEEPRDIKQEPTSNKPIAKKAGQADEPFSSISSSGRICKVVKLFDPQDYEMPRKPRKSKAAAGAAAIQEEENTSEKAPDKVSSLDDDPPHHVLMEPYMKKLKIATAENAESDSTKTDPLNSVRIPRKSDHKSGSSAKLNCLKKANSSRKHKPLKEKAATPDKVAYSKSLKKSISKNSSKSKRKKTKSLKAVKAHPTTTLRPKGKGYSLPLVLTPTKVKTNSAAPLDLDEIPKIVGSKTFSSSQAETWTKKFKEFLEFKTFYGHTAVPHFFLPNLRLSRWVKRQRYQYKLRMNKIPSTMTDKRISLLNRAGFIWDSHTNVWMERYHELSEVIKKHGHTYVTAKYNSCLNAWVKHQRRQYKLMKMGCPSHMTPHRADLLDKIGFKWCIRTSCEQAAAAPTTTKKRQAKRASAVRSTRSTNYEEFQVDDVKPDQVTSNAFFTL